MTDETKERAQASKRDNCWKEGTLGEGFPFESSALRIYLHMTFLMKGGDLNKDENKELLKRLHNICYQY